MYSTKQQALNHYKELQGNVPMHSYNTVDPVVWINSSQVLPLLRDQQFSLDQEPLKMPPMVEANWDTNDTKEFDRLLNRILFADKKTIH
ncbi:MAG: hypothetical protein H7177_00805 [Rhizobacter sp.]|nr:hypothetical protein [Bacteriovorax sp.]